MFEQELFDTMDLLLQDGKGFLAADESNGTIGKRFATINVENTEENRRNYRLLLATTPELNQYINGVILFEETFTQTDEKGTPIADIFAEKGIVPGIKVDKGLIELPNSNGEKITQGLDGLEERLLHFKKLGARFAKWRNVYSISSLTPTLAAVKAGAEVLARYAAICQAVGIVPIVEPEILMDGEHSIDECADAAEVILHEVFNSLFTHQVKLECIILKPSMVTCGNKAAPFSSPEDIADYTISIFRNTVPAAVPTINFLSGGQSPDEATRNLNAINLHDDQPWLLSFSYGRALQEECLKTWAGNPESVAKAQAVLLERAKLNSLACFGELPQS